MLSVDPELFRTFFNQSHFRIEHGLAGHPLFQLPRLIQLARTTALQRPADVYFDTAVEDIGQRWSTSPSPYDVDETIRRIETRDAFIILKRAEIDPEYAEVLDQCMSDLLEVSGRDLRKHMQRREAIVFIASPHRITTYHIDSECNFLLQVTGSKDISIFSKRDRDVLPEQELERFWTVDTNAAIFKPDLQHRADVLRLDPGQGVHIPVNAPHWVRNGRDISVAVSINYHSHASRYADLYRANYHLRKTFGIDPTPPFESPLLDWVKQPIGSILHHASGAHRSASALFRSSQK